MQLNFLKWSLDHLDWLLEFAGMLLAWICWFEGFGHFFRWKALWKTIMNAKRALRFVDWNYTIFLLPYSIFHFHLRSKFTKNLHPRNLLSKSQSKLKEIAVQNFAHKFHASMNMLKNYLFTIPRKPC